MKCAFPAEYKLATNLLQILDRVPSPDYKSGVFGIKKSELRVLGGNSENSKYECHPFIHILTLNVLLSNTGQLIGNAQSNNCQNFIVAILQSNNMAKIRISFFRNNPRKDYFQHLYGKSRILFSQILQQPQISLDKLEILNRIQSIDIAIMS